MKKKLAPVFILGNPRSGTTLVRLIITAHSKISIPPESEFIVKLFPKYGHINQSSSNDIAKIILDLTGGLIDLEEQWQISLDELKHTPDVLVGLSYAEICEKIYLNYAKKKGQNEPLIWGDKNNAYGNYIDVLTRIFPDARFIHVVRDGRAVLSSYKKLNIDKSQKYAPLLPQETTDVAVKWVDMVDRIDRHLKKYAKKKHLTVHYESFLSDFDKQSAVVCAFLGLEFEPNMINYHEQNIRQNLEPVEFSWKANTRRPLDASRANSWHKELDHTDILSFEYIAGKTLLKHGYAVESTDLQKELFSIFVLKARLRENLRAMRLFAVLLMKRFRR